MDLKFKKVKENKVNDILAIKPHFIIRYGNSIFTLLIVSIIALSFYIRYSVLIIEKIEIMPPNILVDDANISTSKKHYDLKGYIKLSSSIIRKLKIGQPVKIYLEENTSNLNVINLTINEIVNIPAKNNNEYLIEINLRKIEDQNIDFLQKSNEKLSGTVEILIQNITIGELLISTLLN